MRWSRVGAWLTGDAGPVIAVALLVVVVAAIVAVGLTAADRTPGATAASEPTVSVAGTADAHTLAGAIVRVYKGRDAGDLRITQLSAPDPSDAPYARCLLRRPAGGRLFNFDLNWTAMDFGLRGTAPAVRVTIRGPGGAPVVAQVPINPAGDLACRLVRSFSLSSAPTHSGEQYSLTLVLPAGTPLRWLSVWVDGHPVRAPLARACPHAHCYRGFPDQPSRFAPGTPYSVSLTI